VKQVNAHESSATVRDRLQVAHKLLQARPVLAQHRQGPQLAVMPPDVSDDHNIRRLPDDTTRKVGTRLVRERRRVRQRSILGSAGGVAASRLGGQGRDGETALELLCENARASLLSFVPVVRTTAW